MELTSRAMLDEIAKTVDTWHHDHHFMYDLAMEYPEDQKVTYVEIGCYAGASACLMLQRKNTDVISIDTGMVPFDVVRRNIEKFNIHDNNFTYIHGNSHELETFKTLLSVTKDIDILFIDGGHEYLDALSDFGVYRQLVNKGGYIVFDDYGDDNYPGVRQAVHELKEKYTDYEWMGARGNCFVVKRNA